MSDYNEHLISMAGGDGEPYLLALVREQAAKLAAIRALADAHGRQGFLVTPNDIRTTLDAEVE